MHLFFSYDTLIRKLLSSRMREVLHQRLDGEHKTVVYGTIKHCRSCIKLTGVGRANTAARVRLSYDVYHSLHDVFVD